MQAHTQSSVNNRIKEKRNRYIQVKLCGTTDDFLYTKLHTIRLQHMSKNQLLCMKILLNNGADQNYSDEQGNTVLHTATLFGTEDVTTLLLKHGANLEKKNFAGVCANCITDF